MMWNKHSILISFSFLNMFWNKNKNEDVKNKNNIQIKLAQQQKFFKIPKCILNNKLTTFIFSIYKRIQICVNFFFFEKCHNPIDEKQPSSPNKYGGMSSPQPLLTSNKSSYCTCLNKILKSFTSPSKPWQTLWSLLLQSTTWTTMKYPLVLKQK